MPRLRLVRKKVEQLSCDDLRVDLRFVERAMDQDTCRRSDGYRLCRKWTAAISMGGHHTVANSKSCAKNSSRHDYSINERLSVSGQYESILCVGAPHPSELSSHLQIS